MVDINKMLGSLNKSGISKGLLGGLAGGAVAGGLMSKKGRKMAKKAMTYGGIAAVGGLAWHAYKQYQQNQSGTTQSNNFDESLQEQQFNNLVEHSTDEEPLFILKTMVAAAMADGHMDGDEYNNIMNRASEIGLNAEEQRVIFDEIKAPMTIDDIALKTTTPVLAMEVYTASVLAIDEDAPFGKGYLESLAAKLDIPAPLVDTVHREIKSAI